MYDMGREMTEKEFMNCLYKQNLEDAGFTEKEVKDGMKVVQDRKEGFRGL